MPVVYFTVVYMRIYILFIAKVPRRLFLSAQILNYNSLIDSFEASESPPETNDYFDTMQGDDFVLYWISIFV